MEKDVTRKNMNAMWDELKNDIWCEDWLRKRFELTIAEIELFQALEVRTFRKTKRLATRDRGFKKIDETVALFFYL